MPHEDLKKMYRKAKSVRYMAEPLPTYTQMIEQAYDDLEQKLAKAEARVKELEEALYTSNQLLRELKHISDNGTFFDGIYRSYENISNRVDKFLTPPEGQEE